MTKTSQLLLKHGDLWISNSALSLSRFHLLLTLLATCIHSYLSTCEWMFSLLIQNNPFKEATLIPFVVVTLLGVVGMSQAWVKVRHHNTTHTIRSLNITIMMIPFGSLRDQPCASDAVHSATGQVCVATQSNWTKHPIIFKWKQNQLMSKSDKVICITFNVHWACTECASSSHGLHHCSLCGDINHAACCCMRNWTQTHFVQSPHTLKTHCLEAGPLLRVSALHYSTRNTEVLEGFGHWLQLMCCA